MDAKDIKAIRERLGFSQEKLARELGVSFCTVNRWERGRTAPSPMALDKLVTIKDKLAGQDVKSERTSVRMDRSYPIRIMPLEGQCYVDNAMPFESTTNDVGIGGLKFTSDRHIQPGDKVRIFIDLEQNDRPLNVDSDVRWSVNTEGRSHFGVRFGDMQGDDMDRIKMAMLTVPSAVC